MDIRMDLWSYILFIAIFIWGFYNDGKKQLHIAQLEGYKPIQYWWWIRNNLSYLFGIEKVIPIVLFIIWGSLIKNAKGVMWFNLVLIAALLTIGIYERRKVKVKPKKELVFTNRAKRLFSGYLGIVGILIILVIITRLHLIQFVGVLLFTHYLHPFIMLLATKLMLPVEMNIQKGFYTEAQTKIRNMKNLKVVGITGSYGKTSTKYFVKTILSEKYNTIMTPESYNTPMGITKVIREQLKDEHEIFVCEMGARNIGDIKELCDLAGPSIGILTSIGPQHLETFKSIENVAKTKYELIESLPEDGTAIFNGDSKYCYELAKTTKIETYIYGIENASEDVFIHAENIRVSKKGLMFDVVGRDFNFECHTRLLGKHNISNILSAICVALKLGLTPEEIRRGIEKIKPVPHRLELLDTNNGVTVIDDAFNSNPVGAREALLTIKDISDGNRIVITPGMVELGEIEYEENKKFGKTMTECCDYAILVGLKRSKPIQEGLKEGKFPEDRIIVVSTLDEATARLGQIVKIGDVVLFENDLPDNYNEG